MKEKDFYRDVEDGLEALVSITNMFYRDVEDGLEALVYASNDDTHRRYRTCGPTVKDPDVSTDMRTRVRTRVRRTPLESSRWGDSNGVPSIKKRFFLARR